MRGSLRTPKLSSLRICKEDNVKKLLFSLLFVWMVGVATAQTDRHGSPRPAVWRSSATTTADTNVFIASDTIHFHGVTISSPAANIGIEIYNPSPAPTLTPPFTRIDYRSRC